jgi:hypothetical protein
MIIQFPEKEEDRCYFCKDKAMYSILVKECPPRTPDALHYGKLYFQSFCKKHEREVQKSGISMTHAIEREPTSKPNVWKYYSLKKKSNLIIFPKKEKIK